MAQFQPAALVNRLSKASFLGSLTACSLLALSAHAQILVGPAGAPVLDLEPKTNTKLSTWAREDAKQPAVKNVYGDTGLITLPSARFGREGDLGFGFGYNEDNARLYGTFTPANWLEGSFRYTFFAPEDVFDDNSGSKVDRSASVKVRLLPEGQIRPAISAGVMDVLGTGVLSSEFVAASRVQPQFNYLASFGRS